MAFRTRRRSVAAGCDVETVVKRWRGVLLLGASGVAGATSWATGEPTSLVVVVIAVALVAPLWVALLTPVGLGVAFYLGLRDLRPLAAPDALWPLASFVVTGLITAALVGWYRSGRSVATDDAARVIESIPGYGWATDQLGRYTYVSAKTLDFLGKSVKELDRRDDGSFGWELEIHPDELGPTTDAWMHSLRTGEEYTQENRIRAQGGEYRWFRAVALPQRDKAGKIVRWHGTTIDIDDEKRMESSLRAAQGRLARATQAASLAELSASVAHEVNQPLASIIAGSDACSSWLSMDPPNLERALKAVHRVAEDARVAAAVVNRTKALFKQELQERASVAVDKLVAEVRRLMDDELSERGASLLAELDRELPSVLVDRLQMQQVLVNLIRNAIDAQQESGAGGPINLRGRRDGDNVRIEVRDRGVGIPDPAVIFEPFFTTKKDGMGIGLVVSRSIVEGHAGQLWAEPNEPAGTVFVVQLPAAPLSE